MKAILLVNKEESCTSCLLGIYNKKWLCLATNKDIDVTDRYNIPTWCPLKPMPNRIEVCGEWISEEYQKGWNACLEVINAKPE